MSVPRCVHGPGIEVPADLAEPIAAVLRAALTAKARNDGVPVSAELLDVVAGIEFVARASRQRRAGLVSPDKGLRLVSDPPPPLTPGTVDAVRGNIATVGPTAAARMSGCSRQAIHDRLRRGTLHGAKDHRGRWLIPVSALRDGSES